MCIRIGAIGISFDDDQGGHELGTPCSHQECKMSPEGLADKVNSLLSHGFDHLDDVRAARLRRKVKWAPVASTVPT